MSRNARKSAVFGQPVADTLGQAAAALGVSVAVLKAAKRAGAPGFRHSRVVLDEVKAWLDAKGVPEADGEAPDIQTAKLQKVREEVRKLRHQNERAAGEVIPRSVVASALAAMCQDWNTARVRFEAEGPARMAGKEADECRVVVRGFMDEVGAALAACSKHFQEPSPNE